MVCVTITRKAGVVDDASVIKVRDALHLAIMEVMGVKFQDVELRVRDQNRLDVNSGWLAVEIDTGPGKNERRIAQCRDILLKLNEAIKSSILPQLRGKGISNLWLRIYAKGASMPIGCPKQIH